MFLATLCSSIRQFLSLPLLPPAFLISDELLCRARSSKSNRGDGSNVPGGARNTMVKFWC